MKYRLLMRGCVAYWLACPATLYLLTRSWWFLFLVWLQARPPTRTCTDLHGPIVAP